MSWTSPLTVASTTLPLPRSSVFDMCGSKKPTAVFMTSADWRTKGSCMRPDAEQFADRLHARHQGAVDDVQGGCPGCQRFAEIGFQAVFSSRPPLVAPAAARPASRCGPRRASPSEVAPSNSRSSSASGS